MPIMAQPATATYQPNEGQEGKDVIWVPTPQSLVEKMLDIAKAAPNDYLIDLGSGDGRTVITAARRGIRAHGIEYNPDLVALSRENAAKAGVADKATFATADLFETDLSQAQVITMFLLPSLNIKLRPRLLDLQPGTRIVSNSFTMGDWKPDETVTITENCRHWCTALLWIVPAKVEGSWRVGGQVLKLNQEYQTVSGTLGALPISEGRLLGNNISFTVKGVRYTGNVNGKTMSGKIEGPRTASWKASRA
nr:methyltransferase domain-containing protein [Candidimonas sp. SYP-B2681]